ncbi:hypothetical protein [Pseudomonas sp. UMAB-40]|uniref:hypothetical protein n=1 Tax=Pseudomonas sp. UMAB-40 TaxID=1365407 RepID=UPI001C57C01D|nr:hypothetical protein [Pseudomonas sp. UMAB-40]
MNLQTMHTQDISDVLTAARILFGSETVTDTHSEMFQSSFGGVVLGVRKSFNERVAAYEANKHRVPEVLAELDAELLRRGF